MKSWKEYIIKLVGLCAMSAILKFGRKYKSRSHVQNYTYLNLTLFLVCRRFANWLICDIIEIPKYFTICWWINCLLLLQTLPSHNDFKIYGFAALARLSSYCHWLSKKHRNVHYSAHICTRIAQLCVWELLKDFSMLAVCLHLRPNSFAFATQKVYKYVHYSEHFWVFSVISDSKKKSR